MNFKRCVISLTLLMHTAGCSARPPVEVRYATYDGTDHVVVWIAAGRLWWSRRSWVTPRELWELPGSGPVRGVEIARVNGTYIVGFERNKSHWCGRFDERGRSALAQGRCEALTGGRK